MRLLIVPFVILALFVSGPLPAQPAGEGTTIYPERLYPGDNIVTVSNARGLDRIRGTASANTKVTIPAIPGCPTRIDLHIFVGDATTKEGADLIIYDCDGAFVSRKIAAENWEIRHEYTGNVTVGDSVCVHCEIRTTDSKKVDSIIVDDPRFTVKMPPGRSPWTAVENDFHYDVCYRPTRAERFNTEIILHIRRAQPNGGLTTYIIRKPLTATSVEPPPPPVRVITPIDTLPLLEDPTTFRNIVMPTSESVGKGRTFAGTYDLAGVLAGYGVTDRLTLIGGGAFVPAAISKFTLGTIGGKYEIPLGGELSTAVGFQYGYSSTKESNISVSAPYAVISLGDRSRRISVAAGYSWKHHNASGLEFDRNAYILAIGGDVTLRRGLKLVAETYVVESSGLAPVVASVRWFGEHYAFDAGLGVDLNGLGSVRGTGGLTGEVDHFSVAPLLSFIWRW
ncbi:MAG: hypothetical protein ABIR47_10295 [Candidatus Kapaibacterium sp.]